MKLAIGQIDATVGDIRGNIEKIRGTYRRAAERGADVVLFPELCVPGYPPRDLLDRSDFIRANLRAVESLAREAGEAGLVVGYAEPNRERSGKPLRNAAALLHKGKVLARRYKTLLPDYDVFDETRYFEPAASNAPFAFKGKRLGLSICEDAWSLHPRTRYAVDPLRAQAKAGAELLLNIAASPFEKGKPPLRRRLLAAHSKKARLPLVYCSLVGGNDELIFDGNSFALDARGRLIRQAKAFAEDLVFVDPFADRGGVRWSEQGETEQLYCALLLGVRDYAAKCGFRRALVGLSGGIDSAVVCVLAADALGPGNVTGVSMPSMFSSKGSVTDAEALARNLGVELRRIPIAPVYASMTAALGKAFQGKGPGLAEQNLQSRIRGNLLMALSNKTGAILLSTGNKSELSVGYCTLYGDMSGGLAVIADLPKKEVYALARWINRGTERIPRSSIDKPPSAELKPGQRDQDDLPPYDVLDAVVCAYVEEGLDADAIARRGFPPKLVRDILGRVDRSEYKRLQAPPALRVSAKAFGSGWRMPIARGSHRG
ncbi:MAG: NAD+ synthase [Elusimicrobiota bacterium]